MHLRPDCHQGSDLASLRQPTKILLLEVSLKKNLFFWGEKFFRMKKLFWMEKIFGTHEKKFLKVKKFFGMEKF